jgi:hypothetical protein
MTNSAVTSQPAVGLTDKIFWHGYIPFFARRQFERIAEFGVYKGCSIRWLLERFPQSQIYGADILPIYPEWPVDVCFYFNQLNQDARYPTVTICNSKSITSLMG